MNETPKSKALELAKKVSTPRNRVLNGKGEAVKKISKCETCGRGHTNHASYVYKTGNLG